MCCSWRPPSVEPQLHGQGRLPPPKSPVSRSAGGMVRYVRGSVVRRRRSHRRRRIFQTAAISVAFILVIGVAAWRLLFTHNYVLLSFDNQGDQNNSTVPGPRDDSAQDIGSASRPGRVVYPYSLVP